ncbi:hypothetical protein [Marinobacterium sp. BA1]|uniref:hypothetical protein n=1 Tax=Marinobacterium sp. BA1 TaxID=3138931 RepID=UPI0032E6F1AA
MTTKQHPLKIENWGTNTYIVGSKGHHNIDEFMAKVREFGYDWPLGKPTHEWLKAVPNNTEGGVIYAVCMQSTRGAFPATVAREAYGKEQYRR